MKNLKISQPIPTRWQSLLPTILHPAVDYLQLGLLKGEEEKYVSA